MVRPGRTPPRMSISSCSKLIRAPRPYPARRRASAWPSCSVVTCTPAGTPSRIATSAGPCDSPAVSQRNMQTIVYDATQKPPSATRTGASEEVQCLGSGDDHRVVRPVELERRSVAVLDRCDAAVNRQQLEVAEAVQWLDTRVADRLERLAVADPDVEGCRRGGERPQLQPHRVIRRRRGRATCRRGWRTAC